MNAGQRPDNHPNASAAGQCAPGAFVKATASTCVLELMAKFVKMNQGKKHLNKRLLANN